MFNVLALNPETCTGCRRCEAICSFYHEKVINPRRSRIAVIKYEDVGLDIPITCRQCEDPPCAAVCPTNAIYRDEKTTAMLISKEKCIGCKQCIIACPFGAPLIDHVTGNILLCDLCGGNPKCAEWCPTTAIEWTRADSFGLAKKREGLSKMYEIKVLKVGQKSGGS